MNRWVLSLAATVSLAMTIGCANSSMHATRKDEPVIVQVNLDQNGCPQQPETTNCQPPWSTVVPNAVCANAGDEKTTHTIEWRRGNGPQGKGFKLRFAASKVCASNDPTHCRTKDKGDYADGMVAVIYKYDIESTDGKCSIDPYIIVLK